MKALWERKPIALTICLVAAGLLTAVQLTLQTSAQDRVLRAASRAFAQQTAAQVRAFLETRRIHAQNQGESDQDLAQAIHIFNQAVDPRMVQVRKVELLPLAEVPAESFSLREDDTSEWTVLFKVLSLEKKSAVEVSVRNSVLSSFGYTNGLFADLHVLQLFALWAMAAFLSLQMVRIRGELNRARQELEEARVIPQRVVNPTPQGFSHEWVIQSWGQFRELLKTQGSDVRDLLRAVKELRDRVQVSLQQFRDRLGQESQNLGAINSASRALNQARTQWKSLDVQFYNYALQWEKLGGDPTQTDALVERMVSLRTQTEEAFRLLRDLEKKWEQTTDGGPQFRNETDAIRKAFQDLGAPIERVSSSYVQQARGLEKIMREVELKEGETPTTVSVPANDTLLSQPLEQTADPDRRAG